MPSPKKNDTLALEEMLPKPVLAKLSSLAENGSDPLSHLLSHVIELGLKRFEEERHPANGLAEPNELSPRQRTILNCLRSGYSVGEIATALGIAETTVRTHITRLKEQFDCPDLLNLRLPGHLHSDSMGLI